MLINNRESFQDSEGGGGGCPFCRLEYVDGDKGGDGGDDDRGGDGGVDHYSDDGDDGDYDDEAIGDLLEATMQWDWDLGLEDTCEDGTRAV